MVAMPGVLIGGIARGAGLHRGSSESGRRVTTSHSSGPARLRSIRVCTRRLTISMATGPFSPSRTVNRVHAVGVERLAPIRHRLPRGLRAPAAP